MSRTRDNVLQFAYKISYAYEEKDAEIWILLQIFFICKTGEWHCFAEPALKELLHKLFCSVMQQDEMFIIWAG